MAEYSVPDGTYMIWGETSLLDGTNNAAGFCDIKVNGTEVANTGSGYELANGAADLSIFTAATLTGGGSVVEMDCDAEDFTAIAQSGNLMLLPVDALN